MEQNPDLQNSNKQNQGIMEQSPDLEIPYNLDEKTLNQLSQKDGIMEQSPDLEYRPEQKSQSQGGQK